MTWQPIETAPKDGDVLLYCPRRGVVRGRWDTSKYAKKPRPYWTNDRECLWGIAATRDDQPTHWMPLPSPPCPDCHETKTAGERAADGAPLVCTACQGGRR